MTNSRVQGFRHAGDLALLQPDDPVPPTGWAVRTGGDGRVYQDGVLIGRGAVLDEPAGDVIGTEEQIRDGQPLIRVRYEAEPVEP